MGTQQKSSLLPRLGYFTTLAIVVGAVIGSGIFKKPALMAEQLGSPELMILIWIVAGVITLFGALTNAEIAGMITETGGQYVYFRRMYGTFIAFLYGWALFAVIQSGSIASISYVFSHYGGYFFDYFRYDQETVNASMFHIPFIGNIYPLRDFGEKLMTIGVIVFLSVVNFFGVALGGKVSGVFTSLKVLAILLIVILAFMIGDGSTANFVNDSPLYSIGSAGLFGGIIVALSGAFWSYDGWNNITYIAGEIKQPQKNIPKALFTGTLIILGVYLLINFAFLYILPIEEMAGSKLVASLMAEKVFGASGGAIIAIIVMISTFGTANGTIMATSRVYYAMAERQDFFNAARKVHSKYKTPYIALLMQAVWASLLVLSGTFDFLTDTLIFVSWVFYTIGALGVFVLRRKMPDVPRPYKVFGYPYVPIIFVLFAFAFVIFTLYNDILNYVEGRTEIINSVFGLLLVASGIPFYLYFTKKRKQETK